MHRITALLHTHNDALRLGRCLETVYPCDEIVIVDHGSQDRTVHIAREYGAKVIWNPPVPFSERQFQTSADAWILCLDPRESLTESLAASMFEWKSEAHDPTALAVLVRRETPDGWIDDPAPQTRLVPARWDRWQGRFPAPEASAALLRGELLRFTMP
jgi:glycosyltransferase involved in cell wall biosynthesis